MGPYCHVSIYTNQISALCRHTCCLTPLHTSLDSYPLERFFIYASPLFSSIINLWREVQMDRRGGCCIARYAGNDAGGGGFYDLSKVDMMMLKFRPIAPKPAAAGSCSGGSTTENSEGYVKCWRGKRRKYVRVNGNRSKKDTGKKRKVSVSSNPTPPPTELAVSGGGDAVVTLSLLPETPDRKENSPVTGSPDLFPSAPRNNNKKQTIWFNFNDQEQIATDGQEVSGSDHPVVVLPAPQRRQVVSFVTVECVTETWMSGEGDEERVMSLERDTYPGFISDGQDRVVWTNRAYRDLAGVGGGEEMVVVVVRKDNPATSPVAYPAFTCKVTVTCGGIISSSPSRLTVPCDVWWMRNGGYAWRLDVKAALCLGR